MYQGEIKLTNVYGGRGSHRESIVGPPTGGEAKYKDPNCFDDLEGFS